MLFDDDEQLEVRHVISLAHHDVSIYSGGDVTPEGELFIKRNAICLSRIADGPEVTPDSHLSKPFFLFSENCSAKEDFYFALLRNQQATFGGDRRLPTPLNFDVKSIISLVQKLHGSEEQYNTRWLNALIGRIFLGIYRTKDLECFVREKITKKISRVNRPSFLSSIKVQKMDMGDAAPILVNPRLRDLTVEGECVVEADVRYAGNFRIEVATTASLELGTRFKTREVNLVLAVVLRRLEGHVLFRIKPPPSNRLWFAFDKMPRLEMTIEPIVSSRQITYTVILRQIENRIKEVIAETLVLPFWDDVPFFKTEHKQWRGGIFAGDDAVEPSSMSPLSSVKPGTTAPQDGDVAELDRSENVKSTVPGTEPLPAMEKSHSLPLVERMAKKEERGGLFGRRRFRAGSKTNDSSAASSSAVSLALDTSRPATLETPGQKTTSPHTASPTGETSKRRQEWRSSVAATVGDAGEAGQRSADHRGSSTSLPGHVAGGHPLDVDHTSDATTESDGEATYPGDASAPGSYSSGSSTSRRRRRRRRHSKGQKHDSGDRIHSPGQENDTGLDKHKEDDGEPGYREGEAKASASDATTAVHGTEQVDSVASNNPSHTASSTEENLSNTLGSQLPDSPASSRFPSILRSQTASSTLSPLPRRENTQSSTSSSTAGNGNGHARGQGETPNKRLSAIAAVANATAASAKRWGWNVLQRGRGEDSSSNGNGGGNGNGQRGGDEAAARHPQANSMPRSTSGGGISGTYDLSRPMGRGMPLPPPGTPLPSPTELAAAAAAAGRGRGRGTVAGHISPLPPPDIATLLSGAKSDDTHQQHQQQRRAVLPPPPLPERRGQQELQQPDKQQPTPASSSSATRRRPVPPPPLPRRSRQQLADVHDGDVQQDGDGADGILVVAAPVESEPTTPTTTPPVGADNVTSTRHEDDGAGGGHHHRKDGTIAGKASDSATVEDAEDNEADIPQASPLVGPLVLSSTAAVASTGEPPREPPEESMPAPAPTSSTEQPQPTPLLHKPASSAIADDDDISCWLDNEEGSSEQT